MGDTADQPITDLETALLLLAKERSLRREAEALAA
ncbi:hypothetical protein FHS77_003236 [Paenochrobactrum gallinarii]|uniref:Uncharacterized protein n=1 Tax=Paenochrobactrum gallinarii TaxID=643673 RepID=A0A841MAV2_9HYPH|nr:hypothetical protein [Paenochrobactrum gallinarii]